MLKHIISELKEALVCLEAGRVTLGYPFQPRAPEANFRGKPVLDMARCIGCGACANACPPRLIAVRDAGGYREIDFQLARCTYCGSCRDVCPAEAVTLSPQFETATASPGDLRITLKLRLVMCRLCGAVVGTRRGLDRVKEALAQAEGDPFGETEWLDLCIACKRKEALRAPALMLEVDHAVPAV